MWWDTTLQCVTTSKIIINYNIILYGNTYGRRRRERPEIGARVIGIADLRNTNNNNIILCYTKILRFARKTGENGNGGGDGDVCPTGSFERRATVNADENNL